MSSSSNTPQISPLAVECGPQFPEWVLRLAVITGNIEQDQMRLNAALQMFQDSRANELERAALKRKHKAHKSATRIEDPLSPQERKCVQALTASNKEVIRVRKGRPQRINVTRHSPTQTTLIVDAASASNYTVDEIGDGIVPCSPHTTTKVHLVNALPEQPVCKTDIRGRVISMEFAPQSPPRARKPYNAAPAKAVAPKWVQPNKAQVDPTPDPLASFWAKKDFERRFTVLHKRKKINYMEFEPVEPCVLLSHGDDIRVINPSPTPQFQRTICDIKDWALTKKYSDMFCDQPRFRGDVPKHPLWSNAPQPFEMSHCTICHTTPCVCCSAFVPRAENISTCSNCGFHLESHVLPLCTQFTSVHPRLRNRKTQKCQCGQAFGVHPTKALIAEWAHASYDLSYCELDEFELPIVQSVWFGNTAQGAEFSAMMELGEVPPPSDEEDEDTLPEDYMPWGDAFRRTTFNDRDPSVDDTAPGYARPVDDLTSRERDAAQRHSRTHVGEGPDPSHPQHDQRMYNNAMITQIIGILSNIAEKLEDWTTDEKFQREIEAVHRTIGLICTHTNVLKVSDVLRELIRILEENHPGRRQSWHQSNEQSRLDLLKHLEEKKVRLEDPNGPDWRLWHSVVKLYAQSNAGCESLSQAEKLEYRARFNLMAEPKDLREAFTIYIARRCYAAVLSEINTCRCCLLPTMHFNKDGTHFCSKDVAFYVPTAYDVPNEPQMGEEGGIEELVYRIIGRGIPHHVVPIRAPTQAEADAMIASRIYAAQLMDADLTTSELWEAQMIGEWISSLWTKGKEAISVAAIKNAFTGDNATLYQGRFVNFLTIAFAIGASNMSLLYAASANAIALWFPLAKVPEWVSSLWDRIKSAGKTAKSWLKWSKDAPVPVRYNGVDYEVLLTQEQFAEVNSLATKATQNPDILVPEHANDINQITTRLGGLIPGTRVNKEAYDRYMVSVGSLTFGNYVAANRNQAFADYLPSLLIDSSFVKFIMWIVGMEAEENKSGTIAEVLKRVVALNAVATAAKTVYHVFKWLISAIFTTLFSWDPFNQDRTQLLALLKYFLDWSILTHDVTSPPNAARFLNTYNDALITCNACVHKREFSSQLRLLCNKLSDLEPKMNEATRVMATNMNRPQPVAVCFWGNARIGKSVACNNLANLLSSAMTGNQASADTVYNYNFTDFWEGYHGQVVTNLDELYTVKDDALISKATQSILAMINTQPYMLNMAFAQKGMAFFNSPIVVATTNKSELDGVPAAKPEAIGARFMWVTVLNQAKFAVQRFAVLHTRAKQWLTETYGKYEQAEMNNFTKYVSADCYVVMTGKQLLRFCLAEYQYQFKEFQEHLTNPTALLTEADDLLSDCDDLVSDVRQIFRSTAAANKVNFEEARERIARGDYSGPAKPLKSGDERAVDLKEEPFACYVHRCILGRWPHPDFNGVRFLDEKFPGYSKGNITKAKILELIADTTDDVPIRGGYSVQGKLTFCEDFQLLCDELKHVDEGLMMAAIQSATTGPVSYAFGQPEERARVWYKNMFDDANLDDFLQTRMMCELLRYKTYVDSLRLERASAYDTAFGASASASAKKPNMGDATSASAASAAGVGLGSNQFDPTKLTFMTSSKLDPGAVLASLIDDDDLDDHAGNENQLGPLYAEAQATMDLNRMYTTYALKLEDNQSILSRLSSTIYRDRVYFWIIAAIVTSGAVYAGYRLWAEYFGIRDTMDEPQDEPQSPKILEHLNRGGKGQPNAVRVRHVVAAPQLAHDQVTPVIAADIEAKVNVELHYSDGAVRHTYGFFVESRTMVTISHVWDHGTIVGVVLVGFKGRTSMLSPVCYSEPDGDFSLWVFPESFQPRKTLINRFSDTIPYSSLKMAEISLVNTNFKTGTPVTSVREGQVVVLESTSYQDLHVRKTHTIREGMWYTIPTAAGDCGELVYYEANGAAYIVGMHVCGNYRTHRGCASYCSQQRMKQLVEKAYATMTEGRKPSWSLPPPALTQLLAHMPAGAEVTEFQDDSEGNVPQFHTSNTLYGFPIMGELNDRATPRLQRRTDFVACPTQEELEFGPCEYSPAALKPVNGEDPYDKALKRMEHQIVDIPPIQHLEKSWELFEHFYPSPETPVIGDLEGAINGDQHNKPLPKDTSAGFPLKLFGMSKKSNFMEQRADGSWKMKEKLERLVNARIAALERGERFPTIYTCAMKDELRLNAKVEALKTRLIFAAPADYTIVMRMYTGHMISDVISRHLHAPISGGVDPHTEWGQMFAWITDYNEAGVDCDFERFDTSVKPRLMAAAINFVNRWYKWVGAEQRTILYHEVYNAFILVGNKILAMLGENPSGQPTTMLTNSIITFIVVTTTIFEITKRTRVPLEPTMLRMLIFGDDHLAVHPNPAFDWRLFPEIIEQNFSMKVTAANKLGAVMARACTEMSYLSRKFIRHRFTMRGPLPIERLAAVLYWAKDFKAATIQSAVNAVCLELTHFDRATYDSWAKRIHAHPWYRSLGIQVWTWGKALHTRNESEFQTDFWGSDYFCDNETQCENVCQMDSAATTTDTAGLSATAIKHTVADNVTTGYSDAPPSGVPLTAGISTSPFGSKWESFGGILDRPYAIATGSWGSDALDTILVEGSVPADLLSVPNIARCIEGWMYFKFDSVKVWLSHVMPPTQFGLLMLNGSPRGYLRTSNKIAFEGSFLPNCIAVSGVDNQSEIVLPYVYELDAISLGSVPTIGSYAVSVFNPQQSAMSTTVEAVPWTLWAQFVNPQVAVPTCPPLVTENVTQMDSAHRRAGDAPEAKAVSKSRMPRSSAAPMSLSSLVSAGARSIVNTVVNTVGETVTDAIMSPVTAGLAMLGLSKPVDVTMPERQVPSYLPDITHVDGADPSVMIACSATAHVDPDPGKVGVDVDEMNFSTILSTPRLLMRQGFSTSGFSIPVSPCFTLQGSAHNDLHNIDFDDTHVSVTQLFGRWRGTMNYDIVVNTCPWMTGVLRIRYFQNVSAITIQGGPPAGWDQDVFTKIVNVSCLTHIKFSIPYGREVRALPTCIYIPTRNGVEAWDGLGVFPRDPHILATPLDAVQNGALYFDWIQPPVCPLSSVTVPWINIWCNSSDMQLFEPTTPRAPNLSGAITYPQNAWPSGNLTQFNPRDEAKQAYPPFHEEMSGGSMFGDVLGGDAVGSFRELGHMYHESTTISVSDTNSHRFQVVTLPTSNAVTWTNNTSGQGWIWLSEVITTGATVSSRYSIVDFMCGFYRYWWGSTRNTFMMMGTTAATLTADHTIEAYMSAVTDPMTNFNLVVADSRINPALRVTMPYYQNQPWQYVGSGDSGTRTVLMVMLENWKNENPITIRVLSALGDDFSFAGLVPTPIRGFVGTNAFKRGGPGPHPLLKIAKPLGRAARPSKTQGQTLVPVLRPYGSSAASPATKPHPTQ